MDLPANELAVADAETVDDFSSTAPLEAADALSTAESLLGYLGTWEGTDRADLLDEVRATRSKTEF